MDNISAALHRCGYQSRGWEVMYNGHTGRQLQAQIFLNPTYYQRLKHMVRAGHAHGPGFSRSAFHWVAQSPVFIAWLPRQAVVGFLFTFHLYPEGWLVLSAVVVLPRQSHRQAQKFQPLSYWYAYTPGCSQRQTLHQGVDMPTASAVSHVPGPAT